MAAHETFGRFICNNYCSNPFPFPPSPAEQELRDPCWGLGLGLGQGLVAVPSWPCRSSLALPRTARTHSQVLEQRLGQLERAELPMVSVGVFDGLEIFSSLINSGILWVGQHQVRGQQLGDSKCRTEPVPRARSCLEIKSPGILFPSLMQSQHFSWC